MATAVELISNKGDKNLGFGSNADIPMSYGEDLDVINKTASQLQLMRAAFNKQMFDQKVADRDNMIKAIDEGQIKVGNVLQKDDPVVNKALESVTDAYANMMKGGGLNNIELVRKYKDAVQQAKSTVTQAQTRFADVTGARTALAKETNPLKRERQQKALSGYEASDFWADYVPPQDFQDLNMDEIIKLATPTTTEYNDPKDRLKKIKETRYSFDNVLKKANENYLEDVPRENQRVLLEQLQSLDPKTAVRALDAYNKQLERYSKETGDKPVKIEYEVGPDGRVLIAETLPDLAAKVALASQPQYLSRSSDVDKGALDVAELGEKARHNRAMEAIDRSKVAIDWAKFDYAKDDDKFGASSVLNEAKEIISKGVETTVEQGGRKVKVLRIGDPNLLKTFGNIDKEGNVTNVPDAIDYDKSKDQLRLIYYRDGKTESGKNFIEKEVALDQRTWLKEIAKRSYPNKDIGKVNNLVDDILNQSGNSLYKLTQKEPTPQKAPANDLSQYDIPKGAKVVYTKDGKPLGYELNGQKYKFD